jgi:hypothetical protein
MPRVHQDFDRLAADHPDLRVDMGDRRELLEKPSRLSPQAARLLALGCSAPQPLGRPVSRLRLVLAVIAAYAASGAVIYFALHSFLEH